MDSAISLKQKLTLPPLENPGDKTTHNGESSGGNTVVTSPSEVKWDYNIHEIHPSDNLTEKDTSTAALVESFRRGDESAFRTIVESYQWRLYCSAIKILKSREDAEEAVAETFAIAFKERKKFRWESGIYTYLWKICFNLSYHIRLKNKNRPPLFSFDENLNANPGYGNSAAHYDETNLSELYREGNPRFLHQNNHIAATASAATQSQDIMLKSAVRSAVARLPRHYSRIILLKDFYDYSYEEISRILSIPRGTVMSRLSRAREQLKKSLKHLLEKQVMK